MTWSTSPARVSPRALLAALELTCDLRARPWTYPGPRAPGSGLLIGGHFHALTHAHDHGLAVTGADADVDAGSGSGVAVLLGLARVTHLDDGEAPTLDGVLRHEGVAPVAARALVVAVGSNGAPDVLRAKFGRAGVSGVVPFVRADLYGVAVGHSAHVSLPGFLAAAPFARSGAVTPVVASLLDDRQLHALDASERTYTRRRVPSGACRWPGGGADAEPEEIWIYDSDQGVVASGPGAPDPLPARTQADLLALLIREDEGLTRLFRGTDPLVVLPALAADEPRRRAIREHLARHWALASGLTPEATGLTPEASGLTPEASGLTPEATGLTPEAGGSWGGGSWGGPAT